MEIDRRRKPVLILECDSQKLEKQNLAIGEEIHDILRTALPTNPIHLLRSTDRANLLEKLADARNAGLWFRTIVLIGHSNSKGLQIASDTFVDWSVVGNYLESFEPRRLLLLACQAGQYDPCDRLFDAIDTLDEIRFAGARR